MKTNVLPILMAATAAPVKSPNVQQVDKLFESFGRGDLAAIINMCSEDCDWQHGGNAAVIPFSKKFMGRKGVAEFFQAIGQSITVTNIKPANFKEKGNEVSHDFHVEATVKATGKPYIADVKYIWTFDKNGQICAHRSTGDFSKVEAAFSK